MKTQQVTALLGLLLALLLAGCVRTGVAPSAPGSELPSTPVAGYSAASASPPVSPTASSSASPSSQTYVVARGDTIARIAQRLGVTVEELLGANPSITDPDSLQIGQVLTVPETSGIVAMETTPAAPSDEPTLAPAPKPTQEPPIGDHPGPLRADGFATVLADDLAVRSQPSTDASSTVLKRLMTGDRVFILERPVDGSGYTWYRVHVSPQDLRPFPWSWSDGTGWVAAASLAGEPWLDGRELDCPSLPLDDAEPVRMGALEHLSCFGSTTLSMTALRLEFQDTWAESMWGSPDWLNYPYLEIEYMTPFWNQMVVRYAPGVDAPTGQWVRLTGHFDDPASATCRGGYEDPATGEQIEIPAEQQVLGCRMRFVVTEWLEP